MSDTATTIDRYLEAYSENDPARRRELIVETFTSGATLADPPLDAAGHDGLDDMFAAVQSQFPGHTFRRSSGVDEHHGFARYAWDLVADDGSVTVAGTDFARLDPSGKLVSVVGFFGPVPANEGQS